MADMATSVLARLKIKLLKAVEAISYACNFFAKRNFCAVWKIPSMLRTLC